MKNCPYCNGIVQDDKATFCSNCGMSWDDSGEAPAQQTEPEPPQEQAPEAPQQPEETVGEPTTPEIEEPVEDVPPALEETPPASEQPPPVQEQPQGVAPVPVGGSEQTQHDSAYQQGGAPPDQQPQQGQQQQPQYQQPQQAQQDSPDLRVCQQCGRQIHVGYQVCPHCGKRAVTQPPPGPVQQQRPMGPPPRPMGPPMPRGRVGAGGMVGAIIGAIMVIVGSFILYYYSSTFGGSMYMGVQDITQGDFVYAWLIPIFGLLVIILAPVAFAMQNKAVATVAIVFGLLIMLIAILLPIHIAVDTGGDIIDSFYFSQMGFTTIYMGGFMAIFGGIIAMSGAASLGGAIKRANPPIYPPQYQQPYRPY